MSGEATYLESPSYIARNAVADAMTVALSKSLLRQGSHHEAINIKQGMSRAEAYTKGRCILSSEAALTFLFENYSDQFKGFYLVVSHIRKGADRLFTLRNGMNPHGYFLVQATDGTWFAGSPANHRENMGEESPIKTIFSDKSLQIVLDAIKQKDNGAWTTEQFIQERLQGQETTPRYSDDAFEFFSFICEDGVFRTDYSGNLDFVS